MRSSKRIKIALNGDEDTLFFTKGHLRIAKGYKKVLIRNKTYIEFYQKNICFENIEVPFNLKWMEEKEDHPIIVYKSKDYCRIKIDYYKSSKSFYCSIFDLITSEKVEHISRN